MKHLSSSWGVALASLIAGPLGAQQPSPQELATASLPPWAASALHDSSLARLALSLTVNPYVLSGDFDGDGRLDVAVLVRERTSRKLGIVILSRARRPVVLGAGISFVNGGDDFRWLDAWHPEETRGIVGAARSRIGILVEHLESASAMIYWDGRRFRWHQLSD